MNRIYTGFLNFREIGLPEKVKDGFDQILCVNSCGDLHKLITSEPDPDQRADPGTRFLNFSGISEEVMDGFRLNCMRRRVWGSAGFG